MQRNVWPTERTKAPWRRRIQPSYLRLSALGHKKTIKWLLSLLAGLGRDDACSEIACRARVQSSVAEGELDLQVEAERSE